MGAFFIGASGNGNSTSVETTAVLSHYPDKLAASPAGRWALSLQKWTVYRCNEKAT
jgi:hypothetical protein